MFKMAQKNTNEKYEIFLYPCRDKIKLELSICAKTFSSFISNISIFSVIFTFFKSLNNKKMYKICADTTQFNSQSFRSE